MKDILKFYFKITNYGVTPNLNNYDKKTVVLINTFSFFTVLVTILFLLPVSIASLKLSLVPLIVCIIGIILTLVSIELNRRKYFLFAKMYFISIILCVSVAIFLLRGKASGSLFLFLPTATLSAIFFRNRTTAFLFFGFICCVFIFCIYCSNIFFPIVNTPQKVLDKMYYLYAIFSSIMLFMIVYFFKTTTDFDQEMLTKKNIDITDSIKYAKLIQDATLVIDANLKQKDADYFIYFKPKDLVSGDFYSIKKIGNKIVFTVADCTGHGVPGALMSIIGVNSIKQIISEDNIGKPNLILNTLNKNITDILNQKETLNNDGMDVSIAVLDVSSKEVKYAGANLSMYICNDDKIEIVKGNRNSIGGYNNSSGATDFLVHSRIIELGDMLYLSSDGYQDQFGGSLNKKMKSLNFKALLSSINQLSLNEQYQMIKTHHEIWKGNNEQTDDILVLGIRV